MRRVDSLLYEAWLSIYLRLLWVILYDLELMSHCIQIARQAVILEIIASPLQGKIIRIEPLLIVHKGTKALKTRS